MSKFFIDRPVLSSVLSIIIVLLGAVAFFALPVARFPEITPPTVQVTASYPGASAETVAESLAAPIEQELSGAKNMLYYTSYCGNDGSLKIVVTFEIGADLDIAAVEVQNRVARAEARLPEDARRQGVTITKSSTEMLLVMVLTSDDPQYNELFLNNYATVNLLDRLKRTPGIGDVVIFGAKDYAMRIWMHPDRLAAKGLTVTDMANAIREQNGLYAAGRIGQEPNPAPVDLTLPVITRGRLEQPSEFEDIILRANPDGTMLRVKDVARAELGSQSYDLFGRYSGKPTTLIITYLQTGANALKTAEETRAVMEEAAKAFPSGVQYKVAYDTTVFVEESMKGVEHTFIEAVILVLLVVFLFLQSLPATIIPLIAVPVSIIGTFAGMQAFGFTTNTLTLFGLVLAIGIVVDDAIVVVENVERIMHDEKLLVREATIKAMDEVTGPVIAIVLVLSAVFVPVAFLGGLTGQMYRQFAITIAVSVVISGIVALTLSPALCRLMLRPAHGEKFIFFRWFNTWFDWLTGIYVWLVRQVIRFWYVSIAVYGLLIFATLGLFQKVPTGFIPDEDQGAVLVVYILPTGASVQRTSQFVERAEKWVLEQPETDGTVTLGGIDQLAGGSQSTAAGATFIILKNWKDRKTQESSAFGFIQRFNKEFAATKEGIAFAINLPSIPGLGTRSGFELQLQSRGVGNINQLSEVMQKFTAELNKRPEITGVASTLNVRQPQLYVELDRDKTKAMGVPISDVYSTLQAYLGALYVNDFIKFGRVYRVQIQAEPEFRTSPEAIGSMYVRNNQGMMAPLSGVITSSFRAGPNIVSRFNSFTAVTITGAPAAGFGTGQAMAAVNEVAAATLPEGYGFEWSGASYQEIKAGNQAPYVLAFGLLVVFLILAAQYEKWTLPFAVILAIPIGMLGALVAVMLRGLNQDIYFQIGLLTLVGLAAKNAILIVEFCAELRRAGKSPLDAALEGARLRFRPILMTSLAFILGVVPLVRATGAGAAGQHSIGTGVMGGMLAATFLAIFFVPLFFVMIEASGEFVGKIFGRKAKAEEPHH
jgi:hydrophobe/amphiphile efflux-1 (HAE1) family protein